MNLPSCRLLGALALLAGLASAPDIVRAETHHTCAGFIDSLPATISTQGVWCLNKDLTTAITSGHAITIATNNVTIDCNNFKIGGLAAGDGSTANGIYAFGRQNVTVRHCNVRGFYRGIYLFNGAGHLVEDNRFDNNLFTGISVGGDNNVVQRNRVYDTGGASGLRGAVGISAWADVIDNTVAGAYATGADPDLFGIVAYGGGLVRNNRVRGLQVSGPHSAYGIQAQGDGAMVDGNQVIANTGTTGSGITGGDASSAACSNNVIAGFSTAMSDCADAGGNTSL